MFNSAQQQHLKQANITLQHLSEGQLFQIIDHKNTRSLSDDQLTEFINIADILYGSGESLISDADYDFVFMDALKKRNPQGSLFEQVGPDFVFSKTVALPEKMLSIDKAYTLEKIEQWLESIKKLASTLENKVFENLMFKMTPKLDGYAAYDDGQRLYTRGDGKKGTDISRVFERGLQVEKQGKRGLGAGEIVIRKTYFNHHLSAYFDNSRNFQASIIKEKELNPHADKAITAGAAVFFPFALLPAWEGNSSALLDNFAPLIKTTRQQTDYDVDGVVLEVIDAEIKDKMGATRHHHRWQIAYKENLAGADVKVLRVRPQISRLGRIIPVAEVEPTRLSGALISRVTAHHYGMVKELGIAEGTVIHLSRSGEVIPKIEKVLNSQLATIPENCPGCQFELIWDANDLYCLNTNRCSAQIENTIEHFFKVLANIDGFGQKNIEKLNAHNISTIYDVYNLTMEKLQKIGFGEKTSQNLLNELQRSLNEEIEDWRFLAAFGIKSMGLGNCENLLKQYSLTEIFGLSIDKIKQIEGFEKLIAERVFDNLQEIKDEFKHILNFGFNLSESKNKDFSKNNSAIDNKTIVFTGTMQSATRENLKKEAKQLGAKIAAKVTEKTNFLVTGTKKGATKFNDALKINNDSKINIKIITEDEYIKLIKKS